jgi:hypothetical protein
MLVCGPCSEFQVAIQALTSRIPAAPGAAGPLPLMVARAGAVVLVELVAERALVEPVAEL